MDDETRMGAMVSKEHKIKVKSYIDQAIGEGGKLIYGGNDFTVPNCAEGYYLQPTIIECTDNLTITKEEVFGPVLQLYKFTGEDEVLKRANDSDLGLAGGILTNDFHRIDRFTEELEVSKISIHKSKNFIFLHRYVFTAIFLLSLHQNF